MLIVQKAILIIGFLVATCCAASLDSNVLQSLNATSCQGRCSEYHNSSLPCHCNTLCLNYGNCCEDFIPVCATLDKCGNRCGGWYDESFTCQCNDQCHDYNNCCEDFDDVCVVSCQNRCNETSKPPEATCYCNCQGSQSSCCKDFGDICTPTTGSSCENRCNEEYNSTNDCHCDSVCSNAGNCCGDYEDFCAPITGDVRYLCSGVCNITRERCDCTDNCTANGNCCTDYQETCEGMSTWKEEKCAPKSEMKCPNGFDNPPVLLFSIDGFKAEYLYRNITPNIHKLARCGVHAPYMRVVYPTKTFPSHYSIVTGLYPESHGIIDNTMYDHEHQMEFRLGTTESFEPFWWGGEPIWVTTSNQGLKSATYFWPGSDVNITRYPDYYYKYDGSVPNEERIYQAFDWLDMPKESRPSFITLYMDLVDQAGHSGGPGSREVDDSLVQADHFIGMLMDGLKFRGLENCVNVIILADHGMTQLSCDRKTSVEDYGVIMDNVYMRSGAFGRIGKSEDPTKWHLFNAEETHNNLRCQHNVTHFQSFLKYEYFPKRFHYVNNDRIEDVSLVVDDEWLVEGRKGSYNQCSGGTHGYDNEYRSMHALFSGHGPGFKRAFNTTEPFESIEVYNLLTDLMGLKAAPNNGTAGSLNKIMSNPKTLSKEPAGISPMSCQSSAAGKVEIGCPVCQGINEAEANFQLDLSENLVQEYQQQQMLYGLPKVFGAGSGDVMDNVEFCMLTQKDYVTAYDTMKKMPFYVSYTLKSDVMRNMVSLGACSRHDFRVPEESTTNCYIYQTYPNLSFKNLYPTELSNDNARYDAAISSNNAPMYANTARIWDYMTTVQDNWAKMYGGIHVTVGPVFDYNNDGHSDTLEVLQQNGTFLDDGVTPIPTHFFIVMVRCFQVGQIIADCNSSPQDLETLSFIIPNYKIPPCFTSEQDEKDWIPGTLLEHVARVKDVELLTGISFLEKWTSGSSFSPELMTEVIRTKIWLPQFTGSWLEDFLSAKTADTTTSTVTPVTTSGSSMATLSLSYALMLFASALLLW